MGDEQGGGAGAGSDPNPAPDGSDRSAAHGGSDPSLAPGGSLESAAFHAVRWTAAGRLIGEVAAFAATVALARLLTPADFGLATVALVAVAIALAGGQQGLAVPLVQRKTLVEAEARTAVTLSVACGAAIALLVALASAPLAEPLFGEDIAELIPLTAPLFLIAALGAVSQALLERRLRFAPLAFVAVVRATGTAAAAVALALAGVDAEALVLGPVIGSAAATVCLLALALPPRPGWDRAAARSIGSFGLPALGSGLTAVGSQQVDYAVLAARVSPASVGLYWRAFTLGVDYQSKLTGVLVQIGLPLYARTEELRHKHALRSRIVRLQTLVLFPLQGALVLLAPVAVPLVFGSQWEDAVLPTQILAVAGMMAALQTGLGPLILAVGRPGALLRWNISKIVLLGALVWLVAPLGLVEVCVAVAVFNVVRGLIGQQLLLRRVAGVDIGELWRDCMPALVATAAMIGLGLPCSALAEAAGAPDWAADCLATLTGIGTYLGVLSWRFPRALAELRGAAARLGSRSRAAPLRPETTAAP